MRPSRTDYSAVFSALLSMGFSEPLVAMAIEAEGEDVQRCLSFLLSLQQSPSSPAVPALSALPAASPASSLYPHGNTEVSCTGTLPTLSENPTLRGWCQADNSRMDATKKFFGSDDVREALEGNGERLWNAMFRRDFVSYQIHRLCFAACFLLDPDSFSSPQRIITNRSMHVRTIP